MNGKKIVVIGSSSHHPGQPDKLILKCDGLCKPDNPGGWACWGFSVQTPDGKEIDFGQGCIGFGEGMTNNVAEYHAVVEALKWVRKSAAGLDVEIQTDSKLIVTQVDGTNECHAVHLRPLCNTARQFLRLTKAKMVWIPREQNELADAHCKVAYYRAIAEKKKAA